MASITRPALALMLLLVGLARAEEEATATARAAAERPIRIMPLGDSITEGTDGDTTYRYWLQEKLVAAGYRVDFVGSREGVAGGRPRFTNFDQDHEGHWGWTTSDVRERIDQWAEEAKADAVLLHLGTNDLGRDPEAIATNLAAIIDSLRRANPKVAIFAARLIPAAGVSAEVMVGTNEAIARMAAGKNGDASAVIVVDQHSGFDLRDDSYDGLHPNEAGERKMAERWFEAIRRWIGRQSAADARRFTP